MNGFSFSLLRFQEGFFRSFLSATTEKCNDSLQKEVEEERNASGVATNEAMSMITRLQEEKAALQMEALQYLRMM